MDLSFPPISRSDEPFLLSLYASVRAEEMSLVPWSDEQKAAFLQMQHNAQQEHYFSTYPQGKFQLIKSGDENFGRLYTAELEAETRIIDLTIAPAFRGKGIGRKLLSDMIRKARKPLTIYLEKFNPWQGLFEGLGFKPISEEGIYQLWKKDVANDQSFIATQNL